jgi:hypothetical protein
MPQIALTVTRTNAKADGIPARRPKSVNRSAWVAKFDYLSALVARDSKGLAALIEGRSDKLCLSGRLASHAFNGRKLPID